MLVLRVLGLLLSIAATRAAPLASIHVKFVSAPHTYEHGITTDGGSTIAQKSFLSVGRRSPSINSRQLERHVQQFNEAQYQQIPLERSLRGHIVTPENAESLWPIGVFLPPIDINDLGYSSQDSLHLTTNLSDNLELPDPYLLTGEEAALAVKYIYGQGELFFSNYPHVRALLRNQEERRLNGLHGHLLSSLRPDSPFYRKNTAQ